MIQLTALINERICTIHALLTREAVRTLGTSDECQINVFSLPGFLIQRYFIIAKNTYFLIVVLQIKTWSTAFF